MEYSKAVKISELLIHATYVNLKKETHYVEWKITDTPSPPPKKPTHTIGFHLFEVQEQANLTYSDSSQVVVVVVEVGNGWLTGKGHKEIF